MNELRELEEGVWVCDRSFRVAGMEIGTRMTVVRLDDGGLFLHSPVALTPGLRAELEALGPIRHAVGPNLHHHLYLADYRDLPDVRLYATPGLEKKKAKTLRFDAVLCDEAPDAWRGQIDQLVFQGAPFMGETVFFHRRSGTLLLTDLCFNYTEHPQWPARTWLRLMGGLGRFGPPRHVRWLFRDKRAARRSIDTILAWDVRRVVVTHGIVLQQSAKRVLRQAFAFLPEADAS
ncbi:MAG: DUF4336 domain-containing protein [Myxococcota bacterium]